jgi:hypothetical protein
VPTCGYDAFFPDPGAYEQMTCRVCGTQCRVTRSRIGPTGFTEAVTGRERPHDRFVCPHADAPWHNQALGLLREVEAETDPLLARALRIRLRRLLAARGMSGEGERKGKT